MGLPPALQERIQKRFGELTVESEAVLGKMRQENAERRQRASANGVFHFSELNVATEAFYALQTKFLSLINLLSSSSQHLNGIYTEVKGLEDTISSGEKLKGLIHGLQNDFNTGMLDNISSMIEANVAADYLGQAEQLLKEGQPGKYDHVPAAVLTGAILEDSLHRLCQRQNPPIALDNAKGEPKTLNPLIDDLKKANVFNELKAKQLRSWADIRNAAAHGEFDKFTRGNVEQLLLGVQNFLADYL